MTVTVRFGRIGAAGQAQVRSFGEVTLAAEAHRVKLIAEKSKKGYLPIASMTLAPPRPAASALAAASALCFFFGGGGGGGGGKPGGGWRHRPWRSRRRGVPDEDTLVLPEAWRVAAWPRRDRDPGPASPLPPGSRARTAGAAVSKRARLRLHNDTTEPDVRAAGLAYLEARLGDEGRRPGRSVLCGRRAGRPRYVRAVPRP